MAKTVNYFIGEEAAMQGHYLTGTMHRSIEGTVSGKSVIGTIIQYGAELNEGIEANDDFQSFSHKNALRKYFILRGLTDAEATMAANRTAKKHAEGGIPTIGSYEYSATGERLHFIEIGFGKSEPIVNEVFSIGADEIFNEQFFKQKSERI